MKQEKLCLQELNLHLKDKNMEYLGNLIIIGIYVLLEVKFDEQIRATLFPFKAQREATKLMHSFWQNAGRLILIIAIIWNQPMEKDIIALHTFLLYTLFYWVLFDSVFAKGVLKQNPWYLGTTSRIDKLFPKWSHFMVWNLKILGLAYLIYFFIITY